MKREHGTETKLRKITARPYAKYLEEKLEDPRFRELYDNRYTLAIGLRIMEQRRRVGLSQRELAARSGMQPQNLARLESPDYSGHTIRTLVMIAEALGTRLDVRFVPK